MEPINSTEKEKNFFKIVHEDENGRFYYDETRNSGGTMFEVMLAELGPYCVQVLENPLTKKEIKAIFLSDGIYACENGWFYSEKN
jgi:hypothetical protein